LVHFTMHGLQQLLQLHFLQHILGLGIELSIRQHLDQELGPARALRADLYTIPNICSLRPGLDVGQDLD